MTRGEMIRRRIKSAQILRGYDNERLAVKMGLSYGQLMTRLRTPEMIKVGELERFERVLGTRLFTD